MRTAFPERIKQRQILLERHPLPHRWPREHGHDHRVLRRAGEPKTKTGRLPELIDRTNPPGNLAEIAAALTMRS